MASSVHELLTFIRCGYFIFDTTEIHEDSRMDDIHSQVRRLCGSYLPSSYHLKFYHGARRNFVTLNEPQLDEEYNPFRIAAHHSSPAGTVELYVIDNAEDFQVNDARTGIACHEAGSTPSLPSVTENETPCQGLPVCDIAPENDLCDEDLLDALSFETMDMDVDVSMLPASTLESILSDEELAEARNREAYPTSGDRCSRGHEVETAGLSNALLPRSLPVHNSSTNNNLQAPMPMGASMPPQNDPSNRIAPTNPYERSTELLETSNERSDRFHFVLDVKRAQKDIHISDQINKRDPEKKNGSITRIQGTKANRSDRTPTLPKLHFHKPSHSCAQDTAKMFQRPAEKTLNTPLCTIPSRFRGSSSMRLLIYAVSERRQDGKRVWLKHRDKGFLQPNFPDDKALVNPFVFDVSHISLTLQGDMILKLYMISKLSAFKVEQIHELDEEAAKQLHAAEHDPSSPRLLCLLVEGPGSHLREMCLSDFIRNPNGPERIPNHPVGSGTGFVSASSR